MKNSHFLTIPRSYLKKETLYKKQYKTYLHRCSCCMDGGGGGQSPTDVSPAGQNHRAQAPLLLKLFQGRVFFSFNSAPVLLKGDGKTVLEMKTCRILQ